MIYFHNLKSGYVHFLLPSNIFFFSHCKLVYVFFIECCYLWKYKHFLILQSIPLEHYSARSFIFFWYWCNQFFLFVRFSLLKVGTAVVTRSDGRLALGRLGALCEQVCVYIFVQLYLCKAHKLQIISVLEIL
jgi:hypothetical protein